MEENEILEQVDDEKSDSKNDDAKNLIFGWWKTLHDDDHKGECAELRRCADLRAIQLHPFYNKKLYVPMLKTKYSYDDSLALVAGALAWVKKDMPEQPLGKQMATSKNPNQPRVSELRLKRLMQVGSAEDFLILIRRVIAMLDYTVNVKDLITLCYYWEQDWNKRKLAREYYSSHKNN